MQSGENVRGSYRRPVPEWTRGLAPAFALITLVTAVLALAYNRPWSAVVALIWLAWAGLLVWRPVMTVVTDSGIRVRRGLGWRTVPWTDVAAVALRPRWDGVATVRLSSGENVVLPGVPAAAAAQLEQLWRSAVEGG